MLLACPHARRSRRLCGALLAALIVPALAASSAAGHAPQLRRYPYLTDAVAGGATVSWATDRTVSTGSLTWGKAGTESCTAHTAPATRTSITVNGVGEYQWSARLTGDDDTRYCYRVLGDATDLLDADPSPEFVTQMPAGSPSPFSFAVFGDWGQAFAGGNPEQAGVLHGIAQSGARFAIATGDTAYPSGGQTSYGDLVQTGTDVSAVFGPDYWTVPGRSVPLFSAVGNHGFNSTFLTIWPSANAASSSGGRYAMDTYCCTNGTQPGGYPSAWYSFDQGGVRFYVLQAAWSDSNNGTADPYENDHDNHWTPTSAEYRWLESDLAAHPSQAKIAVWHYPLFVDNATEPSDTFLQGADSLQGLLDRYGVGLAFNGHAHVYQRNAPDAGGLVTYVTGGGGANVEPVNHCSATDAYAIGWSNSTARGSACGAASRPTAKSQVFHFLLVHVDGTHVTVTPTDSTGATFDVQSYDLPTGPPADTTAPTAPANVTATAASPTSVGIGWDASTDDVGVTGYKILRDGAEIADVPSGTTYTDDTAQPDTTYQYAVKAYDAAGNMSAAASAPPVTTPSETTPVPGLVRQATASTPSGTTFDVPIASTAGHALVAAIALGAGSTASVSSVTDSAGNTWTKGPVGVLAGSSTRVELWYRTGAASVSSVTITLSSSKAASANVSEYRGVATDAALDASAGAGNASSTTASTPSITTTGDNELVVGAVNYPGAPIASLDAGSGFTGLSSFGASNVNGHGAYRVAFTAGAQQVSWTLSSAAASGGAILALKAAPAPPPPDTTAPTTPANVTATATSATSVHVAWDASTDDVGVAGYKVLRDGAEIADVPSGTTYDDATAQPDTTYGYAVKAYDAAGNLSAPGAAPGVTTPPAPPPPPAFVRDATGSTASGTTFGVPIASTTGDTLVAAIALQAGATASVTGVSDSAGNTWTKGPVGFLSGSNSRIELWYRTAAASVSSVTVTLSSARAASANVSEYSGVAASSALDSSAGAGNTSSTTASTPAITTTDANDLVVGAVNYPGSAISALTGTAFTPLTSFTSSTVNGRAAYRIAPPAGTQSVAWTLSSAANSGGAILALKGAG